MDDMIFWILLTLIGMFTHFAKQMFEYRKTGHEVTIISYWTQHKLISILSVLGTFALFIITYRQGYMNDVTAYTVGYMGNSAIDAISNARKNSLAANIGN